MKVGYVRLAGYINIAALWVAISFLALTSSGIRGTGFAGYFVVMLLAGLLLGVRAATGVAFLSILGGFGIAYVESTGLVTFTVDPPFVEAIEFSFLFVISIVIIRLTINSLQKALDNAKANARELETSNQELSKLRDELESHIQERTVSLEKRASQLQTVSSLARSIASVKDLATLLPDITRLVSEQFGFYHVGIFLVDDAGEYAILQAANSDGGREMLHRGHRLPLDTNSIVGYVTSRGEYRIAMDVGADAVHFRNPYLPQTRAEMALPLRVGGQVIGALDMQSTQVNAFSEQDIPVLYTLADQVAVAIENARLYEEVQKALAESRTTFENYVRQEWGSFAQQARHTGFVFDGKQVTPLDRKARRENVRPVIQTGKLSVEKSSSTITLPIKLRGQTIGVLEVNSKTGEREWSRDEITLLEAAAERAALALENARLVESAQRRASRERSIGEISARIGSVSDIESILQTAVEELGRKLSSATEVTLELDREQL
ncbi:MAG TPA: GAF domain-containing protein [Anaerolineales bacterium]|nr:GAF domain-containing protein [Anaerolineales bacterium]